ncbi:MAG: RnfABCDGE type electron transport complex subunit G [Oscillospiraceae bacterium]|nr:RnfABCDGE type electron transport complex subunit G [Oscillospiraceae bacterium]
MTKKDILAILKTALSLFIICAVTAGIVAGVNALTAPTIEKNEIASANAAKSAVLSDAVQFEDIVLSDGSTAYIGKSAGGETVGYVFRSASSGYGGKIEIMTGFNTDGYITGVQILSIDETPGLGLNAKKDSFLNRFKETNSFLSVVKDSEAGENEILALTSATITSRAMVKAVNEARAYFDELSEK